MKNKFKGLTFFILPILILSIATPQVAFASWWNPYTWFKKETIVESVTIHTQQPQSPVPEHKNIEPKENIKPVAKPTQAKKSVPEKAVIKPVKITPVVASTTPEIVPPKENYKLEDVIQAWRPYVVRVTCVTLDSQGNKKSYSDGSGLLTSNITKGPYVVTNKHVFKVGDGSVIADYCDIYFPENKETIKVKNNRTISKVYDIGMIVIPEPNEYILSLTKNAKVSERNCVLTTPDATDDIVILGYPKGKTKDDISYSLGKIIGYDDAFFISSATIVSGYSGGVAVSLKDNCYLGIPTYAKKDDLSKSLILDINKFIAK